MASDGDGIIESGENETEELARAAQNPVANMISLPFQNNTDFNFGPKDKTLNTTNIQPVIPFELNDDWNLITRTIIPVVSSLRLRPVRAGKPDWVIQPLLLSFLLKTLGSGSGGLGRSL